MRSDVNLPDKPPLVAPEPPEPPDGVEPHADRASAAEAAMTTRERVVKRAVTGTISWFGRRTDPGTQGGIMARGGFR